MDNDCNQKLWGARAAQSLIWGVRLALATLAFCGVTLAQDKQDKPDKRDEIRFKLLENPTTPAAITPPAGNMLFLAGHGAGTQGYICLPKATGASWTVNGARPEATLFVNYFGAPVQIITHFLSANANPNEFAARPLPIGNATWQSSFDSSKVWAAASPQTTIPAGPDPSCPNTGSIGCLLLQVIGTQEGPTGGKILSKTTFIQRLNTNGGSAPATGCSLSTDVGRQILVPYSADYYFYRKAD